MREGFHRLSFDTGHSVTLVIPIIIGDDERTFLTWRRLFKNGVFTNPVISPETALVRQLSTSYLTIYTRE